MAVAPRSTICTACGWVYDQVQGDPDGAIAPTLPGKRFHKSGYARFVVPPKRSSSLSQNPPVQIPANAQEQSSGYSGQRPRGYSLARKVRQRDAAIPIVLISADGVRSIPNPCSPMRSPAVTNPTIWCRWKRRHWRKRSRLRSEPAPGLPA